jgi:hypothetical protein
MPIQLWVGICFFSKLHQGFISLFPLAASCDKCNHNEAYFYQLQIRSADEPMTTCAYSHLFLLIFLIVRVTVYRYDISFVGEHYGSCLVGNTDVQPAHTGGVKTEGSCWSFVRQATRHEVVFEDRRPNPAGKQVGAGGKTTHKACIRKLYDANYRTLCKVL